jgi:hypothetical protein
MNDSQTIAIPFEKQSDGQSNRMCGAAALSMVYSSFAKPVAQADLWPKVSKHNRLGSLTAATHLIAQDALKRGYHALAIQAKHPLQVLRKCQDSGIRAILNHRLNEDEPTGHFTVLVSVNADEVVLHDPYFGPSRQVKPADLLALWRPRFLNSEIAGDMVIAIIDQPSPISPCQLCHTTIPENVDCPKCAKAVPLQPAALLGCVGLGCPARMWNYLCCPFCDFTWSFNLEGSLVPPPPEPERDPWDLNRLFEQLEKFTAFIASVPVAASHPDVIKQMNVIKTSQEQLKLAQTEQRVHYETRLAEVNQLANNVQLKEEALLKKKEEIEKPAPPLDGMALGQALLKDLGFQEGVAPAKAPTKAPKGPVADEEQLTPRTQEIKEMLKKRGLWK